MSKRPSAARKQEEPEALVIKDPATLRAFADPVRIQILMELSERPKTVKEVAAALDSPVTRLYYHFKILERARLIRVSGRRKVSGIEERTYTATADSWVPAPEINPTLVESGIVDALLEVTRSELELAFAAQGTTPLGEATSPVPVLAFTRLALAEEDVEEFQRRIEAVMLEFGETGRAREGKRVYHALMAGYQAPAELRDRHQGERADAPAD